MIVRKKFIFVAAALILLIVNSSFLTVLIFNLIYPEAGEISTAKVIELTKEEQAALEKKLAEKYAKVRFSLGDAIEVCSREIKSRNSNLFQLNVNELSTRFDEKEEVYFVQFDAIVGEPLEYDEKIDTCHVDPDLKAVSYYQEILIKHVNLR